MDQYCSYLSSLGYSESTVNQQRRLIPEYLEWLGNKTLKPQSCGYQEILSFIEDMMEKWETMSNRKKRLNQLMIAITNYYDYLALMDPDLINPARNIRVKSGRHRLVRDVPKYDDILNLYKSINPKTPRELRNMVMLGFIVHQALNSGELQNIQIQHINFRAGTIFIPGAIPQPFSRGSCSRELPLDASQLMDLLEYVNQIRPAILHREFYTLPGKKPQEENRIVRSDQLLLSMNASPNINNALHHMFRNIRKINKKVKNATQIRQSVIANWLTKYDIRRVQYMAGHRYVSSTERYKSNDLEELQRKINKYHPLKSMV